MTQDEFVIDEEAAQKILSESWRGVARFYKTLWTSPQTLTFALIWGAFATTFRSIVRQVPPSVSSYVVAVITLVPLSLVLVFGLVFCQRIQARRVLGRCETTNSLDAGL